MRKYFFIFLNIGLKLVPFLFLGSIALLHIWGVVKVDTYGLALLILACLPAILPIIARSIKTFKISKEGMEVATTLADFEGKIISKDGKLEIAANSRDSEETTFPYPVASRRILATLWFYQKEGFGENSLKRWGFGVGLGASDYSEFQSGVTPLTQDKMVHVDQRGICYLTNEGMDFCREKKASLEAQGPFYKHFAPAG
jgi:hypothetical protein